MELKQDDYILGLWIASDAADNCCTMIVKRDKSDMWHVQLIFRENKSSSHDPFDGKDKKSVKGFNHENETEEAMLAKMDVLFSAIKLKYNGFSDCMMVRGDFKKFLIMSKTRPWLHMKQEKVGTKH